MSEKLILGVDTFDNVVDMMNSPDEENVVVGLECIENVDFKSNMTFILLLKKMANVTAEMWKEHAPETYNKLVSIDLQPEKPISYKQILETIIKYKVPERNLQFYSDQFARNLQQSMKKMGYDSIDEVEIILSFKQPTHEPVKS